MLMLFNADHPQTTQIHALCERLMPLYLDLLKKHQIEQTPAMHNMLETLYLPLSSWVAQQHQSSPVVIGINGAQGSGKSTLTDIVKHILIEGFQQRVVSLSIDDLYLTQAERLQLADDIHPLLATRGVPGTHDVELGVDILNHLKSASDKPIHIPVFNKAIDDRASESDWQSISGPVDIILLEGWCVGARACNVSALSEPINELERNQDSDGAWRNYVNKQLATTYRPLFNLIDRLIFLEAPSIEKVIEWRTLQEKKLVDSSANKKPDVMSEQQIRQFIMYFERITRHSLETLPAIADITLKINDEHQVCEVNLHTR